MATRSRPVGASSLRTALSPAAALPAATSTTSAAKRTNDLMSTFLPKVRRISRRLSSSRQGATAMADNGLMTVKSAHSVKDTIDRLAADVTSKGMQVFARVDHAKGAHD